MPAAPVLTIRALRVRAVDVPMRLPLQTGGGAVSTAPLVLIDLLTEEGVSGHAYIFCYTRLALQPMARLVSNLEAVLRGQSLAPLAVERLLQRTFKLVGPRGLTLAAISGLDIAAWDALARAAELPLVRLLGGDPRPTPAYNSRGLGIIGPDRAAAEAQELAAGFGAVKVRLGYRDARSDVAVTRAVRRAVGDQVTLLSDYNQCLTTTEAIQRARLLDGEGLAWIEEPTLADDDTGNARIRAEVATPIQLGENWWGPREMARSLAAGACDYAMPDLGRIGGVSGWLRAAALADAVGMPMSCHLYPEVSAHLLAVTPTAHWLEYVDWASPILAHPIQIQDGQAAPSTEPGNGLDWDEDAVRRYEVT